MRTGSNHRASATGLRPGRRLVLGAAVAALTIATGCAGGRGASGVSGSVRVDGSSTVFPISEAAAEEFQGRHPNVRVTVGQSGTGGGFKKLCNDEIDVADASRQIRPEEAEACRAKGIEYAELPIALDGVSVVVNPSNDFASCLTVEQLRRIWEPGSSVRTWRDVNPEWPNERIKLYGPGADSGTFDYFTEAIVGKAKESRSDYTQSEDDNVLVQGIGGDREALGYFGFAYYEENRSRLELAAVDGGQGCVRPSEETIRNGRYTPLSRAVYIYVRRSALERPAVREFVGFYVNEVSVLVKDVGYVPLAADQLAETRRRLAEAIGA